MQVPIIGVTTGSNPENPEGGQEFFTAYAQAIEKAGGQSVFLTPQTVIPEILNQIHGLLLTGGKDVHPDLYPSRNNPGDEGISAEALCRAYGMDCDSERDAYELPLINAAYDSGIPILGICRGFQILNVALGGSLIKDIRTEVQHRAFSAEDGHRFPGDSAMHFVTIDPDSRLYSILGECPEFVNSRHHQGMSGNEKSERLKAVAFSLDGLIEAVESVERPWVLAVQWHPERSEDDYICGPCKSLFEAFVAASRE